MNKEEIDNSVPSAVSEAGEFIQDLSLKSLGFEFMADQAPIIIWLTDQNANCIYVNRKWVECTGQPLSRAFKRGWVEALHSDDVVNTREIFWQAKQTHEEFKIEYRLRSRNGSYRWMLAHGSPRMNYKGEFEGYIGTLTDIHERKVAEQKLTESELQFRKLVEGLPVAIYTADAEGNIKVYNEAAVKLWGMKPSPETKWCGVHKLYYMDGTAVAVEDYPIQKAFREKKSFVQEGIVEKPSGELVYIIAYPRPIFDSTGECIGGMSVCVDITDRKKAENGLQQLMVDLEKRVDARTEELKNSYNELVRMNNQLEQFAYVASHDLQEPIRKIITFIDFIRQNVNEPENVERCALKIHSSAHRMSVLIRDILNYSRLTGKASRFVPVDLNEILQQIKEDFELVIEQKGAQIFFDTLPSINGDPSQLNQLFSNLIGNALKFTTTKPVITILWRYLNKEDKRKNIRLDPSLDYMEILVKDNGIGFDQQYADRIFTIFQRLTTSELYRGTGIGLALCKRIVENHRGYIWASGEEGKGASFYVVLPLQLF